MSVKTPFAAEQALRAQAREVTLGIVAARASEIDAAAEYPADVHVVFAEAGLLSAVVPAGQPRTPLPRKPPPWSKRLPGCAEGVRSC